MHLLWITFLWVFSSPDSNSCVWLHAYDHLAGLPQPDMPPHTIGSRLVLAA